MTQKSLAINYNTMEIFSVKNKVVFITGASRGIGREIAIAFLKLKAVVIGVSRNENKSIKHKNYYHLVCDLKNYQAIKHATNQALKIKKKIDVIINNAGITEEEQKDFYKSFKSFNKTLNVNLTAPYAISHFLIKALKKNKNGGTIINLSSIAAELGLPNNPAYNSSKSGLVGLTKSLARDYGKFNINVNAVLPGYFNTDMNKKSYNNKSKRNKRSSLTMLSRWGKMNELVGTVIFLATNEAKYITAQKIIVDGGIVSKGL